MFVVEVIPLVRGVQIESLSYFSGTDYPPGTLVEIPVRGKTISGVVVITNPVSSAKTALKAATFSLRKLPPQGQPRCLSSHLLALTETLMTMLPAKRGAILFALLPADIRTGVVPYPHCGSGDGHEDPTPQLLTGTKTDRFITYQSIIRTAFAHRGSVLLVVPTSQAVKDAYDILHHGIADRVVCFESGQGKKSREGAYALLTDTSRATLTITTPSFAYLDRPDYSTIIIDEVGSGHYVDRARPYVDHRTALTALAKLANRSLILGDILLRTEDEALRRNELATTVGEPNKRLTLPSPLTIVEQPQRATGDTPFALFSPELKTRIKTAIEGRHSVFLYAARRGLAPVVTCIDCGYIFRCPDSGTPYSLLRTHDRVHGEERWFVSGTSGKRVRALDVCTACGSWRLRERGIGIQHIEDEIKTRFPHVPVLVFDATTATTYKKCRQLKERMEKEKGLIIIGTSMVMPYLPDTIHVSAIVSLDAVRSVPTWRADESLFRLLLELREKTTHEVIVQTRSGTDDLLLYASRGALERFYDDELALRTMLNYPPTTTFYLLTWQGSDSHIKDTETLIKQLLVPANVKSECYTNPQSAPHQIVRHCLIRTPGNKPNPALVEMLRHLPPYISVHINPDRIV